MSALTAAFAAPRAASDDTSARAWRRALAILAGATILRLVIGALVPLFPDETYYWDWSRTLRAGYFDHPPAIALLIRAGTALLGPTALGVRLFPILAGTAAAAGISFTARELGDEHAAASASLIFACMPLAAIGLVLATPDAPMLAAAAAWAMYAVVRAVKAAEPPTPCRPGNRPPAPPSGGGSWPASRWAARWRRSTRVSFSPQGFRSDSSCIRDSGVPSRSRGRIWR